MLILIRALPGDGTATVVLSFVERDLMRWCGYDDILVDCSECNVGCWCLLLVYLVLFVNDLFRVFGVLF